ncbi:unnamed protein product, partial [Prorocentrum cordatum]
GGAPRQLQGAPHGAQALHLRPARHGQGPRGRAGPVAPPFRRRHLRRGGMLRVCHGPGVHGRQPTLRQVCRPAAPRLVLRAAGRERNTPVRLL